MGVTAKAKSKWNKGGGPDKKNGFPPLLFPPPPSPFFFRYLLRLPCSGAAVV